MRCCLVHICTTVTIITCRSTGFIIQWRWASLRHSRQLNGCEWSRCSWCVICCGHQWTGPRNHWNYFNTHNQMDTKHYQQAEAFINGNCPTLAVHLVMYAIGHIRPHSLFADPSLSLTRRSPQFITRLSDLPTCRVAASQLYLCDLFTLAAFARLVRMDKWPVTRLLDVIQVTSIDSSLIYGRWIWPR